MNHGNFPLVLINIVEQFMKALIFSLVSVSNLILIFLALRRVPSVNGFENSLNSKSDKLIWILLFISFFFLILLNRF